MKSKLYLLIAVLMINVSCGKDDGQQPPANVFIANGIEQEIKTVGYGFGEGAMTDKAGFIISTANSRSAFDPEKDFELYVQLDSKYLNPRGIKPKNAQIVKFRIKDESCNLNLLQVGEEGSIIIKMGSNHYAEIQIKMRVKYQKTPDSDFTYHRIECYYKGTMIDSESFDGT